ncbi:MAG: DnaJ domain-containing protein [Hungatella sp.]|jgi:DnaJ-class molecular chaperone|nr:DnaJ domain-containing protein [Hungatella sp.]
MKDYYVILGVRRNDGTEIIKQAYRKLAKQFHPDLNPGNPSAEARFKEIGEAWETLGDEEKRNKYDSLLLKTQQKKEAPAGAETNRSSHAGSIDYENLMKGFQNYFSKENITKKADTKNKGNPLDASALFEQFMGLKK